MASVNKAIIVGNLGQDPELKYSASGDAIVNFSVATTESWKDKNTGEKKEQTEWHRCVAYRKLAEIIGQYVKKGSSIYIEGKLKTRKWEDKNGVERYTTEIVVDEMQMLGGKQEGGQQQSAPRQQEPQRNAQGAQRPSFEDLSDDIPFAYHARGRIGHCM